MHGWLSVPQARLGGRGGPRRRAGRCRRTSRRLARRPTIGRPRGVTQSVGTRLTWCPRSRLSRLWWRLPHNMHQLRSAVRTSAAEIPAWQCQFGKLRHSLAVVWSTSMAAAPAPQAGLACPTGGGPEVPFRCAAVTAISGARRPLLQTTPRLVRGNAGSSEPTVKAWRPRPAWDRRLAHEPTQPLATSAGRRAGAIAAGCVSGKLRSHPGHHRAR